MSSIRLFVLGSLDRRGPMHGHALRLLAENERIDSWAEVSPSAIYGVLKRLAAEDLIEPVRVEREGNYPERQVFAVTDAGRASLSLIREHALTTIVHRPDPVDLALAKLSGTDLDSLAVILTDRLGQLARLVEVEAVLAESVGSRLGVLEQLVMRHDLHRLRGEIAWHEELLGSLPEIIADSQSRTGNTHD